MQFFLPELIYYTCFLFFLYRSRKEKQDTKQGNSFPYVFSLGAKCAKIFSIFTIYQHYLLFFKKYNVILCQLFFQQTGAVKTLPQHNPLT